MRSSITKMTSILTLSTQVPTQYHVQLHTPMTIFKIQKEIMQNSLQSPTVSSLG